MARLSNSSIRRAIVTRLQSDATVTALVPVARVYGRRPAALPSPPFIQYGVMIDAPVRASCLDGQTLTGAIHNYAAGPDESEAEDIGAAIAASLDGFVGTLTSPFSGRFKVRYTDGRTLDDPLGFHRISSFSIFVET